MTYNIYFTSDNKKINILKPLIYYLFPEQYDKFLTIIDVYKQTIFGVKDGIISEEYFFNESIYITIDDLENAVSILKKISKNSYAIKLENNYYNFLKICKKFNYDLRSHLVYNKLSNKHIIVENNVFYAIHSELYDIFFNYVPEINLETFIRKIKIKKII